VKFPFKFKKSKADDEDDDEDFEESEGEGKDASPAGDNDGDDDDEDFDDDDEGSGGGKGRLIIIAAVSVVVLAAAGGGAWWFLGGEDAGEAGAESSAEPGVPMVSLAIPPKNKKIGGGGMSPPGSLNALANQKGPGAGIVVPSVTVAAFATLSPVAPDQALSEVPDPELVEESKQGPLPKLSKDGRSPWQVYARPSDPDEVRPRIAIVIGGLGMSRAATEAAINRLPGAVTLAFDPYAGGLNDWVAAARKAGHEVLMGLPMEPRDFPIRDPGPYALMTSLEAPQILQRLNFVLSRASGYVGLISVMGSRFAVEEDLIRPLLMTIRNRGLMYIDNDTGRQSLAPKIASAIDMARAIVDSSLDSDPSKVAIDAQLVKIEDRARRNSVTMALGRPFPATLDRLAAWISTLEGKKLALVPVSAIANKQKLR
jgi:polysaccharide deacetylase 2 family uncharacterized protein YibQ